MTLRRLISTVCLGLSAALLAFLPALPASSQDESPGGSRPTFELIDAHTHAYVAPPAFLEMLQRWNVHLVNISVIDDHESREKRSLRFFSGVEPQHRLTAAMRQATGGRAAWVSTFDPSGWETPGFSDRVNKSLDKTFDDGAVGVKIYKSIGMELKSRKTGRYLLPDDPVFDPIFEHIAARGKTLYAHIAEPAEEWVPLPPSNPYYWKEDPFWNIYGHPDRPSKATIIAARDHMLAKHPTLRVVGCHLGSLEDDVDELGKRFDLYPNFAVDTSGRVNNLMQQSPEKVRAFILKYQDRLLYGSDEELLPWQNPQEQAQKWQKVYTRDWKYFSTSEMVDFRGKKVQGLALPDSVLRKLFHDNAVKWVPGVLGTQEADSTAAIKLR